MDKVFEEMEQAILNGIHDQEEIIQECLKPFPIREDYYDMYGYLKARQYYMETHSEGGKYHTSAMWKANEEKAALDENLYKLRDMAYRLEKGCER